MSMFNRAVKMQFNHMKYADLKSTSKRINYYIMKIIFRANYFIIYIDFI